MELDLSETSNSGEEESKSQLPQPSTYQQTQSSPTNEQQLIEILANRYGGDKRIYNLVADLLAPSNDDISTIFDQDLLTHLCRTNPSIDSVSHIAAFLRFKIDTSKHL
jgi:hypothetical protein